MSRKKFESKPNTRARQGKKSVLQLLQQDVSDLSDLSEEEGESLQVANIVPESESDEELDEVTGIACEARKTAPIRCSTGNFQPKNDSRCKHKNTTPSGIASPIRTVLSYFNDYFDDMFFKSAAEYTNMYSVTQTGKSINTNYTELKRFVGMNLMMGCIRYPRIKLYWQRGYICPIITQCMSRDRFIQLRNYFHVVDNNNTPCVSNGEKNKLWKVQPIIDAVRDAVRKIPRVSKTYSIDDQMISFTGRCPV